ncbi:beta-glucuronidase [Proteiniclasticum sp. SCR006]|uniref:Beta-glucuronidase n=1 Tax=Proteiniclasticum aestuarii TaxID=2817862 RepID=A0A939KHH3_9CLOT|nr:beta-glucuronidase [Proteiniclasticum aestuarii]MBO1265484.1 beta-glucuronidase [Proteiniclasticum aestuarii]
MLYPISTQTRTVMDLSGIWKFSLTENHDPRTPLSSEEVMAVPGSYNEQGVLRRIRNHVGSVWYEKEFEVLHALQKERLVLRFGSATHQAKVYVNGQLVMEHKGGFMPFEAEINDFLQPGKNRVTVEVNNILDYTTLPVGNYSEKDGVKKNAPNFDFFNYAGIHRPVKIYTTPKSYVEDITITYEVKGENAQVHFKETVQGDHDRVRFVVRDEEGAVVCDTYEKSAVISEVKLWNPLAAYLYEVEIHVEKNGETVDLYRESFGIRTVEVKDNQFLINGKPFYFKGFGKHEDFFVNGRGLNEALNVTDLNLMKWLGANSFRTAHYPYSEEMMRLCDRQGIVVIDETPAVGIMHGFNFALFGGDGEKKNTYEVMDTREAHEQVLRELIARDKNLACVVMWSVANEAATQEEGADAYFAPLIQLTRDLDPQKRPVTMVLIMMSMPHNDLVSKYLDVICLNRYYGWYINTGELEEAKSALRKELSDWKTAYPDTPVMFTEYGADTVAGFHAVDDIPFTEEYQVRYLQANHEVFDEFDHVIGEQMWNFADFETSVGIIRVQGNKKGLFTRQRQPKMAAHTVRERWMKIPDFEYKKR